MNLTNDRQALWSSSYEPMSFAKFGLDTGAPGSYARVILTTSTEGRGRFLRSTTICAHLP